MGTAPAESGRYRYWLFVLVLFAFGLLTIFSFGMYLWVLAVALALLGPFRSRPKIFLPGLALVLGFLFAYVLVAPWGCSQTFAANPTTGEEVTSAVVCTSPTGIEYVGPEPFEPDRTPALIAGGATAVVAGGITWIITRSRRDRVSAAADV